MLRKIAGSRAGPVVPHRGPAFAHVGQGHVAGFVQGISHPLSGLDHIIAMVAVGLYASHLGGRNLWLMPSAFIATMIFGGILGYSGFPLPLVEGGIGLSVVVMSLAVAAGVNLPTIAAMALVSLFAVFHGHAHGSEGAALCVIPALRGRVRDRDSGAAFFRDRSRTGARQIGASTSLALKKAVGVAGAIAGVAILSGLF